MKREKLIETLLGIAIAVLIWNCKATVELKTTVAAMGQKIDDHLAAHHQQASAERR